MLNSDHRNKHGMLSRDDWSSSRLHQLLVWRRISNTLVPRPLPLIFVSLPGADPCKFFFPVERRGKKKYARKRCKWPDTKRQRHTKLVVMQVFRMLRSSSSSQKPLRSNAGSMIPKPLPFVSTRTYCIPRSCIPATTFFESSLVSISHAVEKGASAGR